MNTINNEALLESVTDPQYFDVVVIGGGVAGLTAGMYAARDGFKTLVLEGTILSSTDAPGGALLLTSEIANFPGFPSNDGASLVANIREQCESSGALIREERAENIEINPIKGKCHSIITDEGRKYGARTIIVATGSIARRLWVPGEDVMFGQGVSTCATCDGFFFKNKTVAVAGGGDTAVEDAILLTRYAEKVYLLVRGEELRASGPEAREILSHPDIEIMWNTEVEEVISDDDNQKVIGLCLSTKEEKSILPVDGLFVAIGSDPSTGFLKNSGIPLDDEGYIKVKGNSTAVDADIAGVFAAGDVADKIYRQAITSAGKAAQAAMEARHYLNMKA